MASDLLALIDGWEFQSLFFWNHYLDLAQEPRAEKLGRVSILVFLEPLLRLDGGIGECCRKTLFQSLFFWNHYLDLAVAIILIGLHSFNPCFSGTTT